MSNISAFCVKRLWENYHFQINLFKVAAWPKSHVFTNTLQTVFFSLELRNCPVYCSDIGKILTSLHLFTRIDYLYHRDHHQHDGLNPFWPYELHPSTIFINFNTDQCILQCMHKLGILKAFSIFDQNKATNLYGISGLHPLLHVPYTLLYIYRVI